jgi:hypothetical protein
MIHIENVPVPQRPGFVDLDAEASTLGLKPGTWPQELSGTDDAGEPLPFYREHPIVRDGELVAYVYLNADQSWKLTVFND